MPGCRAGNFTPLLLSVPIVGEGRTAWLIPQPSSSLEPSDPGLEPPSAGVTALVPGMTPLEDGRQLFVFGPDGPTSPIAGLVVAVRGAGDIDEEEVVHSPTRPRPRHPCSAPSPGRRGSPAPHHQGSRTANRATPRSRSPGRLQGRLGRPLGGHQASRC